MEGEQPVFSYISVAHGTLAWVGHLLVWADGPADRSNGIYEAVWSADRTAGRKTNLWMHDLRIP